MKIFGFDIIFFCLFFPIKLLYEFFVSCNEELFSINKFIFEFFIFLIFRFNDVINSFINKIILFASF